MIFISSVTTSTASDTGAPIHRSGRPGSQDNFRRSFRVVSDNSQGAIRKPFSGGKNPGAQRKNPGEKPGLPGPGHTLGLCGAEVPGKPAGAHFRSLPCESPRGEPGTAGHTFGLCSAKVAGLTAGATLLRFALRKSPGAALCPGPAADGDGGGVGQISKSVPSKTAALLRERAGVFKRGNSPVLPKYRDQY